MNGSKKKKKDKTLLYLGIGAAAIMIFSRPKNKPCPPGEWACAAVDTRSLWEKWGFGPKKIVLPVEGGGKGDLDDNVGSILAARIL